MENRSNKYKSAMNNDTVTFDQIQGTIKQLVDEVKSFREKIDKISENTDQRKGQDTGFMTAGGQNWQRHCHGTLPHAGNVLNGQNTFISHYFSPQYPDPIPAPGAGTGDIHFPM